MTSINTNDSLNFEKCIYHGRGPGQAALKAFNWYCRKSGLDSCDREFCIEEITKNKKNKQYFYKGNRIKLEKPKEINRGNKIYYVYYETIIKRNIKN